VLHQGSHRVLAGIALDPEEQSLGKLSRLTGLERTKRQVDQVVHHALGGAALTEDVVKADRAAHDPAQPASALTQPAEGLQEMVGGIRPLVARDVSDGERDFVHGDHE
jgi:hypothetical protein